MFLKQTILLFSLGILLGCQPAEQPVKQPVQQFSPAVPTKTASQHLDAGLRFVQEGEHDKALTEFSAAIEIQPSAHAYSNRGLIYSSLGEHDKSLADHNKAVELGSSDSTNYYNRSLHFIVRGESDKAIADLNEAIRLEPTLHASLTARGEVWQNKGDYGKAFADYRHALLFAPGHFLVHNYLAWLLATCPDDKFRNGNQALEHAKKACELSGWRWETVDTLAAAWAEIGEFEKAVNAQEKAIEAAPLEQRPDMEVRLNLYQQKKPYRLDDPSAKPVEIEKTSTTLISDLNADAIAILRSLPNIYLDIKRSGPDSKPSHRIIHIADFHFVEREKFTADIRELTEESLADEEIDNQYQEFLYSLEGVQSEQGVMLRCLIEEHGLKELHIEGLSKENQPAFDKQITAIRKLRSRLKLLRTSAEELETGPEPDDPGRLILTEVKKLEDQIVRDLLRMGIAARLHIYGELERLLPLEEETAYRNANPIGMDGRVSFDSEKNEAREDAQVQLLMDSGPVSVIVLGGAHDLSDNIKRLSDDKAEYVRVQTRTWKDLAGDIK